MRYVLLLGSNLGDSLSYLHKASNEIENKIGKVVIKSEIISTDPIGEGVHSKFLNQAIVIDSELLPETVLDEIENIELKLGRKKSLITQWNVTNRVFEDRTIDIDIALMDSTGRGLFYDSWNSDRLCIPHKAINNRPFIKTLLDSLSINF